MNAISDLKGTKYACNLVHWGPNMLAMSEIVLESRGYDFSTNHAKKIFLYLQTYMIRFGFEIAGKFYSVISQQMGAVKLFQFDTLFSELIIMRNIKTY